MRGRRDPVGLSGDSSCGQLGRGGCPRGELCEEKGDMNRAHKKKEEEEEEEKEEGGGGGGPVFGSLRRYGVIAESGSVA